MNTNTSKSISSTNTSFQKQVKTKGPVENNPFCLKKEISYFLHDLVNKKGFPKESLVYKPAGIKKTTWSNIYSGLVCPEPLTSRQLVIGLRCTVTEATEVLKKCGYCWTNSSFDKCIKDCLRLGIYTWSNEKPGNDVISYIFKHAPEWLDGRYRKLAA